jgi:outer membrane immunogenic protein
MKKVALAAVIAAFSAASASAADMAVKAPPMAAPVPLYNWTGFYVGGNVGYGFGRNRVDVTTLPSPVIFNEAPFSFNEDSTGFLGGVQAGYNWQSGRFVFGVEADITFGQVRGSGIFRPITDFAGLVFPTSFQQTSQTMDWIGTARLRAGFTPASALLLYATGGLAYGHTRYNTFQSIVPGAPVLDFLGSDSATQVGWTVGGGAEWAFGGNWSVKAEYLYYDLGNHSLTGARVGGPAPIPDLFFTGTTFQTRGNIVRMGLNYHFGGPVVAKY